MTVAVSLLLLVAVATLVWLAGTVAAAVLLSVPFKTVTFGTGPTLVALPLGSGQVLEVNAVPVMSNIVFAPRTEVQSGRAFADLDRGRKLVLALAGCAACVLVAMLLLGGDEGLRATAASWAEVFGVVTHLRDPAAQWEPMVSAIQTRSAAELIGLACAKVGGFNLLPLAGLSGWVALSLLFGIKLDDPPPFVDLLAKFTLMVLFGLIVLWGVSGVEYVARALRWQM